MISTMTTITLHPTVLSVTFTRTEKVAGLLRDLQVPLSAVRSVEVVPDGITATRGLRAPGLGLPGIRKIGTWRAPGSRSLVSVRAGRPALRITLEGQRYAQLLLEADDAVELAAALAPTTT
jgi:hypothetical protein